jgi:hypothetical protein
MSDAYVIEIGEIAVGVVVREGKADGGRRYCFYAANAPFRAIDGKAFPTPEKARKAAIALIGKTRKSARPETVVRY